MFWQPLLTLHPYSPPLQTPHFFYLALKQWALTWRWRIAQYEDAGPVEPFPGWSSFVVSGSWIKWSCTEPCRASRRSGSATEQPPPRLLRVCCLGSSDWKMVPQRASATLAPCFLCCTRSSPAVLLFLNSYSWLTVTGAGIYSAQFRLC